MGAEINNGPAMAVVVGLSVATLFTLVFVPIVYTLVDGTMSRLKKVPADQSLILRDSFSTVEDEFENDERPVCREYWLTGLLGILYFLGKPTVWAPVILWSGRNFRASPNFGLSIDTAKHRGQAL